MKRNSRWVLPVAVMVAVLALSACAGQSTPTPTSKATSSPTSTAKPTSSPSPGATAKTTAAPSAVSFAGKTVTMAVPVAPGGGTDITSRGYARFLPKFLPGNPQVIVRNMPGAHSSLGINYVWGAKPDGLTIGVSTASPTLAQFGGVAGVRYDLGKMPVILAVSTGGTYFIKQGIIQKPEDLVKAKGIIFGSSPGSLPYFMLALGEMLNWKPEKGIFAYEGMGEARRAFLSGEINLGVDTNPSYWSALEPYVKKGEIMLLFQTGILDKAGKLVRDPGGPDVMTGKELYEKITGKEPSGMAWEVYYALAGSLRTYDKPIVLPPNTPDDIVKAYRDSVAKMVEDQEWFNVMSALLGKHKPWMIGEELQKNFRAVYQLKPDALEWIKAMMSRYGLIE